MSTLQGSGLQLPGNDKMRSVVLSYLIHHGHRDTVRAFAKEIIHREAAESVEACPLWTKLQVPSNADSIMCIAGNEASTTLDHRVTEGEHIDEQTSTTLEGKVPSKDYTNRVHESVLEDVGVRRTIRSAIISGNIDEALELITQHLPTFLPVAASDAGALSPVSNSHLGSHDPSLNKSSLPSSAPPVSPSSRSTTPAETVPEPVQLSEKATQKTDTPALETPQTGSPKPIDIQDSPAIDRAAITSNASSLGWSVNPVHILLNLQVQQFLEAVRTIPIIPAINEYSRTTKKGSNEADVNGVELDMQASDLEASKDDPKGARKSLANAIPKEHSIHYNPRQMHLFELAARLYQGIDRLKHQRDREVYAKEIEQVCSLMIAPSPEDSMAAPYLSMERREALADQVNSSMLHHVGGSPAPALQIWAQTTKVVWGELALAKTALPRAADVPSDVKIYARYVVRGIESEDQTQTQTAAAFDFAALARS